jgi:hypothetical protein
MSLSNNVRCVKRRVHFPGAVPYSPWLMRAEHALRTKTRNIVGALDTHGRLAPRDYRVRSGACNTPPRLSVRLMDRGLVLVRWDGDVLETADATQLVRAESVVGA